MFDFTLTEFLLRVGIVAIADVVAVAVAVFVLKLRWPVGIIAGTMVGVLAGTGINSVLFRGSSPLAAAAAFVSTVTVLAAIAYIAWRIYQRGQQSSD